MPLFIMTTVEGVLGGIQVVRGEDDTAYRFIFDNDEVPRVVSRECIDEVLCKSDIYRLLARDLGARTGHMDRFIGLESVGIRENVLRIVPGRWGEKPFDGLDPADTVKP